MSDTQQLIIGLVMLLASGGVLAICLPRKGKPTWLGQAPFLAPALSIVIVGGLVIGLILVASYFTTIDNATLTGKIARLSGAALAWRS